MMILKAIEPIFLNGRIVEAGEAFSCNAAFAKKLVESKTAEIPETESKTSADTTTVTRKAQESKKKKAVG